MKHLTICAALMLAGCASTPRQPDTTSPYWVPLIAQDGKVYEAQILPTDAAESRVVVCLPLNNAALRCLYKRFADGAYGFVTIALELDPKAGT